MGKFEDFINFCKNSRQWLLQTIQSTRNLKREIQLSFALRTNGIVSTCSLNEMHHCKLIVMVVFFMRK
jgi:hypothetical protein